jgi:hypothetical protein
MMYAVDTVPALSTERQRRLFVSATVDLLATYVNSHAPKIWRVRSAMARVSVQSKRTAQLLEQCVYVTWDLLVLDAMKLALEGLPESLAQGMVGALSLAQQAPAVPQLRMKPKKWSRKQ